MNNDNMMTVKTLIGLLLLSFNFRLEKEEKRVKKLWRFLEIARHLRELWASHRIPAATPGFRKEVNQVHA